MEKRIINISHNDFDGVGAALAICTAFPNDHVKVEFVTYDSVHLALKKACESNLPWDKIILSDISIKVPSEDTAHMNEYQRKLIEELPVLIKNFVENGGEFIVLDHHETALPMKDFYKDLLSEDSILQISDPDGTLRAGSELAARFMMKQIENMDPMYSSQDVEPEDADCEDEDEMIIIYDSFEFAERVFEFCELAGDYDVWRNPFGFGGKLALMFSLMDDPYGALDRFTNLVHICTAFGHEFEEIIDPEIEDGEHQLVDNVLTYYYKMAESKLSGALRLADRDKIEHHPKLHQFEPKFFSSHCAMHIYEQTEGVVLMTYPGSQRISFRRHPDCSINLARFCKKYGGGGHEKAAGMSIPKGKTLEDIVSDLISEIEKFS